jgi:serine/threonine-protein kinase
MLGRTLGNYAVVKKLGEGGMGVVYLARHATLGRLAAIKVLRPALSAEQDIVSRFFNEAKAVTAIRHAGIVEVYDFGFLEDRTAYIIMEYLDGESLAMRLRRGRPPISGTLTIIRAITRALQAAHEQGIVHRDLKPDNVFLVPDSDLPGGERIKLLDFGIAKLAHGMGDASHTTTGTVMGTPTYMSPEQCRGAGSVDHRADLYSLGCVAYEMLCGQPPFIADGPGDVIARHLYFEPAPLRSHRSEIAPELENLVLRLLKKEPKARHASAADVVRALDQWMKATPTQPLPVISPVPTELMATLPLVKDTTLNAAAASAVRPKKPPSRPRTTVLAGVATAATLAVLAIVLLVMRRGHDEELSTSATAQAGEPKVTEGAAAALPPPVAPPPRVEPASPGVPHTEPASPGVPHAEPASPGVPHAELIPPAAPPAEAVHAPGAPVPARPTPAEPPGASPPPPVSPSLASPTPVSPTPASPTPASPTRSPAALSPLPALPTPSPAAPPAGAPPAAVPPAAAPPAAAPSSAGPSTPTAPPATTNPASRDAVASADAAPKSGKPSKTVRSGKGPKQGDPKPGTGSKPTDTGGADAPLDKSQCERSAFALVLDATSPTGAAINGAWTRLRRCSGVLTPAAYQAIQDELLAKS